MQRSFSTRLAALEALETPQASVSGQLFEAACWGGAPEDEWFRIDGAAVADAVWHQAVANVPRYIVLIDDTDAVIPPERPLRVNWI
jgi:hypothetical protein